MLTSRPERLKAFDYIGHHAYFLTYCTDQRHEAFADAVRVEVVSGQILRAAADERFALVAYCYMPDHLHLLVNGAFGRRLWQRYGYEHVLRGDAAVLSVARYILENPVRAGIAKSVCDYPFTGSPLHLVEEILDSLPWQPRSA